MFFLERAPEARTSRANRRQAQRRSDATAAFDTLAHVWFGGR